MTINIEYETDQELGIDYAALASQVADKVLEMEKCPYDGQVNLVLTDNEEIKNSGISRLLRMCCHFL